MWGSHHRRGADPVAAVVVAGAVRFAATLERDADGPVVDRIVGFL